MGRYDFPHASDALEREFDDVAPVPGPAVPPLPPLPSYWGKLNRSHCHGIDRLEQRVNDPSGGRPSPSSARMALLEMSADHTSETGSATVDVAHGDQCCCQLSCYKQGVCATTFPGPMGMGASFNRTSLLPKVACSARKWRHHVQKLHA
jgi:hypothetical protein